MYTAACSKHNFRRLAQTGTNTVYNNGDTPAAPANNNFVGAAQQALSNPNNAQNANLAAKQVCSIACTKHYCTE